MSVVIPAQGSGTVAPPIATDLVGTDHYQWMKIDLGAAGVASPLVRGQQTKANSLPVALASDDAGVVLLGTIDADTSVLAGAVAGSEMQVDVVTSALPSGAATAAKQPALGTAGAASADVLSVQGVALMTPLLTAGNLADNAVNSGWTNPVPAGANATTSGASMPTYSNGDVAVLQVGTKGALSVQLMAPNDQNTISAQATNADTLATTSNNQVLVANAIGRLYNGTNFSRAYQIAAAMDTTGTGVSASGILAQFDDVSPSSVTEDRFAPLRMSSLRALYVEQGPFLRGRVTADGQIKASAGFIHTVSIAPLTATPTAGLLTIYDNTSETGTVVYAEWIFATTPGHTVILDIPCGTGIYVGFDGTLANVQVTVAYR